MSNPIRDNFAIVILDYERQLDALRKTAVPFAIKNTLNRYAFRTMEKARQNVATQFTLRNKWTKTSVQFEKTSTLRVASMMSIAGSREKYMATQEFGGVDKGKPGTKTKSIVTGFAARQPGAVGRARTKLAIKSNKIQNIELDSDAGVPSHLSEKFKNRLKIRRARRRGRKHIALKYGSRKGIYRIVGGARNPKARLVWDLTRTQVTIKKNPWLAPAVRSINTSRQLVYIEELKKQLRRIPNYRG